MPSLQSSIQVHGWSWLIGLNLTTPNLDRHKQLVTLLLANPSAETVQCGKVDHGENKEIVVPLRNANSVANPYKCMENNRQKNIFPFCQIQIGRRGHNSSCDEGIYSRRHCAQVLAAKQVCLWIVPMASCLLGTRTWFC